MDGSGQLLSTSLHVDPLQPLARSFGTTFSPFGVIFTAIPTPAARWRATNPAETIHGTGIPKELAGNCCRKTADGLEVHTSSGKKRISFDHPSIHEHGWWQVATSQVQTTWIRSVIARATRPTLNGLSCLQSPSVLIRLFQSPSRMQRMAKRSERQAIWQLPFSGKCQYMSLPLSISCELKQCHLKKNIL